MIDEAIRAVFAFIFNRVFPNMFAYALRYRHYLIVHAWAFFECADRLRVHVRATAHHTRANPAQYCLLVFLCVLLQILILGV